MMKRIAKKIFCASLALFLCVATMGQAQGLSADRPAEEPGADALNEGSFESDLPDGGATGEPADEGGEGAASGEDDGEEPSFVVIEMGEPGAGDEGQDEALGAEGDDGLLPPIMLAAFFFDGLLEDVAMSSISEPSRGEFYSDETIRVTFTLGTSASLVAGQRTTIYFPDKLDIVQVARFPVHNRGDGNSIIAYAEVDTVNNALVITATAAVEGASSVSGYVSVSATFNQTYVTETRHYDFEFRESVGNNSETLNERVVFVQKTGNYHLFYKGGEYMENLEIEWRLSLNYYWYQEYDLYDLGRTVIEDTVGAGHELIDGSVKVIDVGWVVQGPNNLLYTGSPTDITARCVVTKNVGGDPQRFSITIPDGGERPYQIVYRTRITDVAEEIYVNTATLNASNGTPSRTVSNTVTFHYGAGGAADFQPTELTVYKYDAGNNIPLAGARFELHNNTTGSTIATLTTNAQGLATYSAMLDRTAVYALKEVHTPSSVYEPVGDVLIDWGGLVGNALRVEIANTKAAQIGTLEIRKLDAGGVFRLSGAVFALYKDSGLTVQIEDAHGNTTWTTGAGGEPGVATIEGLPLGSYYLVEIQAPVGYQRNTTPRLVTVSVNGGVTHVDVHNDRDETALTIYKLDSNGNPVGGASFTAWRKSPLGNWTQVLDFDVPAGGYVAGIIVGEYRLWENVAPSGHKYPNAYIEFTVTQQDIDRGHFTLYIRNSRDDATVKASVQAFAYDENNPSLGLEGVEYTLTNLSAPGSDIAVLTGSSGLSGIVGGLAAGEYRFAVVEETIPEGYEAKVASQSFTLTEAHATAPKQIDFPFVSDSGAGPGGGGYGGGNGGGGGGRGSTSGGGVSTDPTAFTGGAADDAVSQPVAEEPPAAPDGTTSNPDTGTLSAQRILMLLALCLMVVSGGVMGLARDD